MSIRGEELINSTIDLELHRKYVLHFFIYFFPNYITTGEHKHSVNKKLLLNSIYHIYTYVQLFRYKTYQSFHNNQNISSSKLSIS